MAKVLIIYYSRTGNTEKMAQLVKQGVENKGVDVVCKKVQDVKVVELLDFQGIIVGSPVYYGSMSAEIKKLFDDSVTLHGKLENKIGGAFASSYNIGGGNETTIMDILKCMLIHGMIIKGTSEGDHYGPVAIQSPDERSSKQCIKLGERIAELVQKQ
ncbi:MAG: flavodoxin family protein [bacterium]|nr:flavodoxin family protein [bacterium]